MIPIENFIEDAIRKLRKLEEGYNLYEDGFEKEEFKNLSQEELKNF